MKKIIEIRELNFHDYDENYYKSEPYKDKQIGFYLVTFTGKIKDGNSDALMLWDGYSISYITSPTIIAEHITELGDKNTDITEQMMFKAIAAAAGHSTFK